MSAALESDCDTEDEVTPRKAFIKWSLLGGIAAAALIVAQASAVGGYAGLLQVGERSAMRPVVESELGDVPLAAHSGHDGQISYGIGLDLLGSEIPDVLDHGAYRYRRILYPAVASMFGLLDGEALLLGMIVLNVISAAVAAGVTASIGIRLGWTDWVGLAVLLNPGVWLSVRLLTSDTMALVLMLLGLHFVLVGLRWAAVLAFSGSGLAKDAYLITPGGLAVSRDRRRWALVVIPAVVLAIWMAWLTYTMGEGFSGRGNVTWPFAGFLDAFSTWATFDAAELFYLLFALASVAAGLAYALVVKGWLRWSILGWSIIAIVSSDWVWDLGNNAARVFAPIVVLIALGEAGRRGIQDVEGTAPIGEP